MRLHQFKCFESVLGREHLVPELCELPFEISARDPLVFGDEYFQDCSNVRAGVN